MNCVKNSKHLIVFDFDQTIIHGNSDTLINCLCPSEAVPQHIKDIFNGQNWTAYMDSLFRYLFEQGVKEQDYKECLKKMKLVEGMKELILNLKNKYLSSEEDESQGEEPAYEMIIISDSNTFFIQTVLEHYEIQSGFRKIFANYGAFESNGCLTIQEYHHQDYCDLSAVNLCKGRILMDYLKDRREEGVNFGLISYIGDGQNDLCPGLKLSANDHIFVRKGYRLHKLIQETTNTQIVANVHLWETGFEIHKKLSIVSGLIPPTPPPSPALHLGASHSRDTSLAKLHSLSPLAAENQSLLTSEADE